MPPPRPSVGGKGYVGGEAVSDSDLKVTWDRSIFNDPIDGLSVEVLEDFCWREVRKILKVQVAAEEEAVKEALRQLGWIAPEDVSKVLVYEYNRGYLDGSIGRVGY